MREPEEMETVCPPEIPVESLLFFGPGAGDYSKIGERAWIFICLMGNVRYGIWRGRLPVRS